VFTPAFFSTPPAGSASSPGPCGFLWGEADPFFRTELGRQLSDAFPHGTLTTVPAGRTFLSLDHPGELAYEIAAASRDTAPR
jgi:pimeloyl-ACP methyl ester carboxylesterase